MACVETIEAMIIRPMLVQTSAALRCRWVRRFRMAAVACGVATALAARPAAAPAPWVQVDSPHFTVLSTGGERTGRNLALQFEQIRAALQQSWPWLGDHMDRPIVVVGARDESIMHGLVPGYWEKGSAMHPTSVFADGIDRQWLVVRTDVEATGPEGVNPYQQAYWSYGALA